GATMAYSIACKIHQPSLKEDASSREMIPPCTENERKGIKGRLLDAHRSADNLK
ncbi:hypothetical protein P7K49_000280, partial [Saguinus oedipus]